MAKKKKKYNFVHLHTHSEFSILDGMSRVEEIVDKAVEYDMEAVAITDHGHLGSVPSFYKYAKEKGIKPIIGQEFYIVEDATLRDQQERMHLVLLALNIEGYKTLCRLSTEASEHFYYKPRIDRNILAKHGGEFDNIVLLSSCMSGQLPRAILRDDKAKIKELVKFYNAYFPHWYLEFMQHGLKNLKGKSEEEIEFANNEVKINDGLMKIHKKYGIPLVVTQDSHYIEGCDQHSHGVLLAMQTGDKMSNPKRFKFNGQGYYFCDAKTMKRKFPKIWKKSEKSMREIVDMVDIVIEEFDSKDHYIPAFGVADPDKEIRRLSMKGLKERVAKKDRPRYKKELLRQLKVIKEANYADEFLTVKDYTDFARRNGVFVGSGRGSMVGVLVSYLMGITDVDPIRFNLSFERAINPARPSLPDFDIDFSHKDVVIDYLKEKWGNENTMQIGTYNRLKYRSLLTKLLTVFEVPFQQSKRYTKQMPDTVDIIAGNSPEDFEQLRKELPYELKQLFERDKRLAPLMMKFNNLVSSMGTHAGGLLIGDDNLKIRELIPTHRISGESDLISQFDKGAVEKELGFVKFDILGLTTGLIIQNCLDLIGENIFYKFPDGDTLDDKKTIKLINSGYLTYIFQLDGIANRVAMNEMGGIAEFEDIVSVTSIARPGTNQFVPEFAHNKKKPGRKKYVHKGLAPILDSSHGVLLYQEQVMAIAKELAGFDMVQVDDIKEMIKGKDHAKFEAMKPKFLWGCVHNNIDKETAEEIWKIIERGSGYLYNRSHAVSYSVIAYQTAYLKAHYPMEFVAACLNIPSPNVSKNKTLIQEALAMGIKIKRPHIMKSGVQATIEKGAIRLGLSAVKYVGYKTAVNIVEARNREGKKGIEQLPKRVMRSKVKEVLTAMGAFGKEGYKPEREVELLGFSLSDPVAKYRKQIDKHSKETSKDIVFGGMITELKYSKTKAGSDMLFVDIAVEGNTKKMVLFMNHLFKFKHLMEKGNVILVKATKQPQYDSVMPEAIKVLN